MKNFILLFLFSFGFVSQSFGQVLTFSPRITYANEIQYTYTPTGGTETTVRAIDLNGVHFIEMTTDTPPVPFIPTVLLGGDNLGNDQYPGISLEVLHIGAITGSDKQQIVVKLPEEVRTGTHEIFLNVNGKGGGIMSIALAAASTLNRGIDLYTCPACNGPTTKGEVQTRPTCNKSVYDENWVRTVEILQCVLIGNLISNPTTTTP